MSAGAPQEQPSSALPRGEAWTELLSGSQVTRSVGEALARFLAREAADRGWRGAAWIPGQGAPILSPGLRPRDLAPWAYRDLIPGELRPVQQGLGARLDPRWSEWIAAPKDPTLGSLGILRWLVPTETRPTREVLRQESNGLVRQLQAVQRYLQVESEGQMQASAARLGMRAAGVLHDLRNRLTLLSLQSQRMQADPREAERWKAANQRLVAEMHAMCAGLIPTEHGGVLPQRTELRPILLRLAQRAPRLVRRRAGGGSAGVRLRCRSDLTAWVDPVLIARVVENLLVNALEASGSNQVVSLQAGQTGQRAWVDVRDEGRGMDEATLQRAFQAGQGSQHGTGFGSVSLLAALEDLQGTLDVDSAPGAGTRVRVTLPPSLDWNAALLLDPDGRRRRSWVARLQRQGVAVQGLAHADAAIRSMGEATPAGVYLARGMQDPYLTELMELAAAQGCPVWVLGSQGGPSGEGGRLVADAPLGADPTPSSSPSCPWTGHEKSEGPRGPR